MLTGRELSEEDEEGSAFEGGAGDAERVVRYNPQPGAAAGDDRRPLQFVARPRGARRPHLLEAQRSWLSAIRDFIAINVDITTEDLQEAPDFAVQGGLVRAHALFGDRLRPLLDELPQVLTA